MRISDWSSDVCSSDLRDPEEARYVHSDTAVQALFPVSRPRVFVTHTRPEPFLGALRRLDTGPATTAALGFVNRGGTLAVPGLLFANRSTWAPVGAARSEERRGGKACVSKCRHRWATYQKKQKKHRD